MVWRRLRVPESTSLAALHGIVQLAMGWEGTHLYEFTIRGVRHAGAFLHGQPVDVPLSDFRFRRNARLRSSPVGGEILRLGAGDHHAGGVECRVATGDSTVGLSLLNGCL